MFDNDCSVVQSAVPTCCPLWLHAVVPSKLTLCHTNPTFLFATVSLDQLSELYVNCFTEVGKIPYFDGDSREFSVEVLVDRSIIELFVADTLVMTTRVYPSERSYRSTLSTTEPAFFQGVYVAPVKSIWPTSSSLPSSQVDAAIIAGGATVGVIGIGFFLVWIRKCRRSRSNSEQAALHLLDEPLSADEGDTSRIKSSRSSGRQGYTPRLERIESVASDSGLSAM